MKINLYFDNIRLIDPNLKIRLKEKTFATSLAVHYLSIKSSRLIPINLHRNIENFKVLS